MGGLVGILKIRGRSSIRFSLRFSLSFGFGFSFDSPIGAVIARDQRVNLRMEQLDLHTPCDRKI
jgi:hypothetical protein